MQKVADKHGVNTIKNKTTSLGGRGIIIRGNTVSPGVSRDNEKEVVFKEKKKKKRGPLAICLAAEWETQPQSGSTVGLISGPGVCGWSWADLFRASS